MKVYISSTYNDLKQYRKAAVEIIKRYGCQPLAAEFNMTDTKEQENICSRHIRECDIFIGIYAHRFGHCPSRWHKKSVIQQEYELSKKLGKRGLYYIVKEDFPWCPMLCEFEKSHELKNFINMVKQENTIYFFTTTTDFANKFSLSFGKFLVRGLGQATNQAPFTKQPDRCGQFIPMPPTPYIPHTYPINEDNFVDRKAEKIMLSHWLYNRKEPVLVLYGMNGIGKTTLSWKWLHEEVIGKVDDVEGIIWWSFYEEPFETFIQHLYHYLTSKDTSKDSGVQSSERVEQKDTLSLIYTTLHKNRFLLVLDGLERILSGHAGMSALYTQGNKAACPPTKNGFSPDNGSDTSLSPGPEADLSSESLSIKGLETTQPSDSESEYPSSLALEPGAPDSQENNGREPMTPIISRFLQRLASGNTKSLITTSSFPRPLESINGVHRETLNGLAVRDTVKFFKQRGIAVKFNKEGNKPDDIRHFPPFILSPITYALKHKNKQEGEEVLSFTLEHSKEREDILTTCYNLLSQEEKRIASHLSVARIGFNLEFANSLLSSMDTDLLWEILVKLNEFGFLFYHEEKGTFSFHPLIHSFLYTELKEKERLSLHLKAVSYYSGMPYSRRIDTIVALYPSIELYYHLIRIGRFEEARDIFRERLSKPIYFQFSNHNLRIDLLKELFNDGEEHLPSLEKERSQAWAINSLAISYSSSGQPHKAIPLSLKSIEIFEAHGSEKNIAIVLGNVAYEQMKCGRLSAAYLHLQKGINLCWEQGDGGHGAMWHQELGRLLALQGHSNFINALNLWERSSITSESEFLKSFEFWGKTEDIQGLMVWHIYQAFSALTQIRLAHVMPDAQNETSVLGLEAIEQACKALNYAEKDMQNESSFPMNLILIYWLLGESIIRHTILLESLNIGSPETKDSKTGSSGMSFEIGFFDPHLKKDTESLFLGRGNELRIAGRCLNEALQRCRKANLIELEPNILIATALLEYKRSSYECASIQLLSSRIEEVLKDVQYIAQWGDYRLTLADLHLFCAEVLLNFPQDLLLGLCAREHITKAKEYALDVSELSDLYQSKKDTCFFDGIPDYKMLERGMSIKERVEYGYWIAYMMADEMEKEITRKLIG